MANVCEAKLGVVLPTRNIDRFRRMFDLPDEEENKIEKKKFFCCDLTDFKILKTNQKGMSSVVVHFDCKWSVQLAMFEVHKKNYWDDTEYLTLNQAIKELDIQRIVGKSEEFGIGFLEQITFDKDLGEKAECICEDLYPEAETIELKEDDYDDMSESNEKK